MAERYAVIVPVGPAQREQLRLRALAAELAAHAEPAEIRLIVIDDAPAERDLDVGWPSQITLRTGLWSSGHPPDTLSAHVAGTFEGLRRATDLPFAVKLDTDVAVIAPFAEAIAEAFADERLGVVGSYDRTSDGGVRDWSGWVRTIDRATHRLAIGRRGTRIAIHRRPAAARRVIRATRDAAFAFAAPGAHCLGGAYAVSGSLLAAATLDWRPWVRTQLGEDVVVGMVCSQLGLGMRSLTGRGEPFALAWRGLPGTPEQIAAAGHSIVHSVRCDEPAQEAELRARLQRAGRVSW